MPRGGILGSYGISVLNFLRSLHSIFCGGYTSLRSHQHCSDSSFFSLSLPTLFISCRGIYFESGILNGRVALNAGRDLAGNKGTRQRVLAARALLCVGDGTGEVEGKCPGRRGCLTSSLAIVAACERRPRIAELPVFPERLEILILHDI